MTIGFVTTEAVIVRALPADVKNGKFTPTQLAVYRAKTIDLAGGAPTHNRFIPGVPRAQKRPNLAKPILSEECDITRRSELLAGGLDLLWLVSARSPRIMPQYPALLLPHRGAITASRSLC